MQMHEETDNLQIESTVSRSRSATSSSDSVSLNDLVDDIDPSDMQGIALLRQIFPRETSTEELKRIHKRRTTVSSENGQLPLSVPKKSDQPSSLRSRIMSLISESPTNMQSPLHHLLASSQILPLPYDFLRIPPSIAVRRFDKDRNRWRYEIISDLRRSVVEQYRKGIGDTSLNASRPLPLITQIYSRTLFRDSKIGLGLTLCDQKGVVRVYSLTCRDGTSLYSTSSSTEILANISRFGPAAQAGIEIGDEVIGINENALFELLNPKQSLLMHAISSIKKSPDPVVLHLSRNSRNSSLLIDERIQDYEDTQSLDPTVHSNPVFHSTPQNNTQQRYPLIHPFVASLREYGLLQTYEQERESTLKLTQYTERIRVWEETCSFRLRVSANPNDSVVVIPLIGVRKALSVRILNSFLDGNQNAYCVWVHDVEQGVEFFSPVRYFRDFQDLRTAILRLSPSISQLMFPREPFTLFGSPLRQRSSQDRCSQCRQLEQFLRSVCALIYRDHLHRGVAEIAIHVQSFLGFETPLQNSEVATALEVMSDFEIASDDETSIRMALKRSFQLFTYRLFLLDCLSDYVERFIDSVLEEAPQLKDLEALEAEGRSVLKNRAFTALGRIQKFLDFLQSLILEACADDFRSIAERDEYYSLLLATSSNQGSLVTLFDHLVREAVREQVEIEVYVPLRGVVSQWLVRGWRHDDMELQFKIKELRHRRMSIHETSGRSILASKSWDTVSKILSKRVGGSTLPSVKLRAIVEAARELSDLFTYDRRKATFDASSRLDEPCDVLLGADDFLPIFIHCVVHADLDRPCALCVLLKTLCDPVNKLGEIGYYLASYEATLTHIQEVDLTTVDASDIDVDK